MGRTLSDWELRTRELLGNPNTDALPTDDTEQAVRAAIRRFSGDRARVVFSDYPGNGSTFDLAIPATWVDGFSAVTDVEYPQGDRPKVLLDMAEIELYPLDSDPTAIRLNETTPQSGKTARVYFTVPWPMPDGTTAADKVADTDFEPVCNLAAFYAAVELAGRAAGHKQPTIPAADAVDFENETDRWLGVARERLKTYRDHVGTEEGGEAPADGITDWDAMASFADTGRRFLFRGRR